MKTNTDRPKLRLRPTSRTRPEDVDLPVLKAPPPTDEERAEWERGSDVFDHVMGPDHA